jgi:hypothetical protein
LLHARSKAPMKFPRPKNRWHMAIHVLELTPPFEDDGDRVKKDGFPSNCP